MTSAGWRQVRRPQLQTFFVFLPHVRPVSHFTAPAQHSSLASPQHASSPVPPQQRAVMPEHVPPPALMLHVVEGPMHVVDPGSQQPAVGAFPLHALPAQQGSVLLPHAWQVLPEQTDPVGLLGQPLFAATHVGDAAFVSQHAVPEHVSFAQQTLPGMPQPMHFPPVQTLPVPHDWVLPTHTFAESQQSPLVEQGFAPVQHVRPVVPHGEHTPARHARPLPVQGFAPAQHGSPEPPHVEHLPLEHTSEPASPVALHSVAPAQQDCPWAPHAVHELFEHTVAVPASVAAHAVSSFTHLAVAGSQHPAHVPLAQQMSPPAPHAVHALPEHTVVPPWQSTPVPTQ
jgi:hypothetical protein